MKKLIKIFQNNHGYARMKYLREEGIQTRDIAKAVGDGILEKINPGLYKLIDYPWDEHESFADVCNANKNVIVCLLSAAAYWELTTYSPNQIDAAVPMNTAKFKLDYPPIKVYYFQNKFYELGIESLKTKSGTVRIFNKEKTICDLFRYQKKLEKILFSSLSKHTSMIKGKEAFQNLLNIQKFAKLVKSFNLF